MMEELAGMNTRAVYQAKIPKAKTKLRDGSTVVVLVVQRASTVVSQ